MAWSETTLSDVIVPEVFTQYIQERTAEVSRLFNSGIVGTDRRISQKLSGGGDQVNLPFYKDIDQSTQNRGSGVTIDVNKITTSKDIARLFSRAQAWGEEDLADELSGDSPLEAIGNLVADYWDRRFEDILISILTGVFADNSSNDSGDLILDKTISGSESLTQDALISGENILDAKQLLGDAKEKLTAVAMHSALHTRLQKNDLIDYQPDSQQDVGFGTYMGHSVIVDDDVPTAASGADNASTEYTSYLFGSGAVAFGEVNPKNPTETTREALDDQTALINRRSFILHPRGIAWQEGSVSGDFPTNTEAENAANWSRVYDKKNIRIVKLVTNG